MRPPVSICLMRTALWSMVLLSAGCAPVSIDLLSAVDKWNTGVSTGRWAASEQKPVATAGDIVPTLVEPQLDAGQLPGIPLGKGWYADTITGVMGRLVQQGLVEVTFHVEQLPSKRLRFHLFATRLSRDHVGTVVLK